MVLAGAWQAWRVQAGQFTHLWEAEAGPWVLASRVRTTLGFLAVCPSCAFHDGGGLSVCRKRRSP